MSKCLVLATYNGNYNNSIRKKSLLRLNHIKCNLENINHKIFDKIIIVIKEEDKEEYINTEYNNYLKKLKETNKISIIRIKNDKFLSYSSYYYAFLKFNTYDYYYFFEDDYIITDNFVFECEKKFLNNDYIFGWINYNHKTIHASHCISAIKNKCLKNLFTKNFIEEMEKTNHAHQIAFFLQFYKSHFKGSDFSDTIYSLPFYSTSLNKIIFYFNEGKEIILWPTQYFVLYKKKHINGKNFNNYIENFTNE